MQKLPEGPDRKRDDTYAKKEPPSAKEGNLFSCSSNQQSDNT